MKLIVNLALIFLCLYCPVLAQKVPYVKTFEEARSISAKENKPLFIFINITPPESVTNFLEGFNHPEVAAKFSKEFINYRTTKEDMATSSPLIRKYQVSTFPAFIFLDSRGGLLFKDFGNSNRSDKYLKMAERALKEAKGKSLVQYDNEYALGQNDTAFLKEYILKRRKAGISNNSKLADEFVNKLTVSDLEDYSQVLFILEAGPQADSKAYKLAYTNKKIIDSIYKTEPFEKKNSINNTIINNTMAEAITLKSYQKAVAAANYTRSTWGKNYLEGQKRYNLKLIQYYQSVKDTTGYLSLAGNYYDQYYMRISADSIKRMDEKNMQNSRNKALEAAKAKQPSDSIRTFSFSYQKNTFSTELNNAAYSFYETGTKNPNHLTRALLWSKRSIELDPVPGYYDTLAHLLYRLGFYAEAESTQQKSIELAKAKKQPVKYLQDELVKIRTKTL